MKRLLEIIQALLLRRGVYLAKSSSPDSLKSLLLAVWPFETEHKLVRIGPGHRADGGYLVPDDLDGIARVFSPGVSKTVGFEEWFLSKGIPCELLDGSISEPPSAHPLVNFEPLWLSSFSDSKNITLDEWVSQKSVIDEDLLIQMDIEGAEYEALLAASPKTLERFRIIVVEFHELRSAHSRMGLRLFRSVLAKLNESHLIVHTHPNNCCPALRIGDTLWPDALEITFLRRDRVGVIGPMAQLPHPLDRDNTSRKHMRMIFPD